MRHLFLLIFLSLSVDAFCQQYTPFPTTDAIWRYRGYRNISYTQPYMTTVIQDEQYMITGSDTVIAGNSYKQVMLRRHIHDTVVTNVGQSSPLSNTATTLVANTPDVYYAGIREANKIVYCRKSIDTVEYVLYDFNALDTAATSKDSVLIGNKYHKRYHLDIISVIEGVGRKFFIHEIAGNGEEGITFYCFTGSSGGITENGYGCYYIFPYGTPTSVIDALNDSEPRVYPNPFNNALNIRSADPVVTTIYNAVGAVVLQSTEANINTAHLSNGVYMVVVKDKAGVIMHRQKLIKE